VLRAPRCDSGQTRAIGYGARKTRRESGEACTKRQKISDAVSARSTPGQFAMASRQAEPPSRAVVQVRSAGAR